MAEVAFIQRINMDDVRRELRHDLRGRRAAIPPATRIAAAASIADRLLQLPAVGTGCRIAGYWAIAGELPLNILMSRLGQHARYCLPMLQPDRTLRFAPWSAGDAIVLNRYGIPEPEHGADSLSANMLDVVLLPLLGFTRKGHRIGTGGGWYDRSFAFRRQGPAPPLLIGIGFSCQQIDAYDAQEWDVPLDVIVTERELMLCPR